MKKLLPIIKDDSWLQPFAPAIEGRHQDAVNKIKELAGKGGKLTDFANAYHYYGLHHTDKGGLFANGRPMPPTSTSWGHLTNGKNVSLIA